MLVINPQTCYTITKLDALELWWLDQAVYHQDTSHPVLRCINVRPNIIEAANGFVLHQVLGEHNCTSGTYAINDYKRLTKRHGAYTVIPDQEALYPDTDRITTPRIGNANWVVRVVKSELLWALAIPDTLTVILTIAADGFSVQRAMAKYDKVESYPNPTTAYIQHEVLTQPIPREEIDKSDELRISVNPTLLANAANIPAGEDVLLSFSDSTHAIVVQSLDFHYQAIVMSMRLGR